MTNDDQPDRQKHHRDDTPTASETPDAHEARVRALATQKGYQLRHADGKAGRWNLINPDIDAKAYGFSFSEPHSFSLDEAEALLRHKPDKPGKPDKAR